MIIGRTKTYLAMLALLSAPQAYGDELLNAIFAELDDGLNQSATYVEHKYISFLDVPLVHRGEMKTQAPDTLIRTQTSPVFSRLSIKQGMVTIEDDTQQKNIALETLPPLHSFVESMRAVVLGDLPRLQQHYQVKASGELGQWQLTLTPHQTEVQRYIESLEFKGQHGHIRTIITYETGGDRSEMKLSPLTPKHEH